MADRLWSVLTLLLAIGFVSYLAHDVWGARLIISIPVATLVVGGAAIALLKGLRIWTLRSDSKQFGEMHRAIAEIEQLPLAEAKKRALIALDNPKRFECDRQPPSVALPVGLPNSVRELFSVFATVKSCAGEAFLSRDQVRPAQSQLPLIRIGTDADATEIVVRRGEEPVYEVDGSEADESEVKRGGIPSIYHWILVTEEVLYGESGPPS